MSEDDPSTRLTVPDDNQSLSNAVSSVGTRSRSASVASTSSLTSQHSETTFKASKSADQLMDSLDAVFLEKKTEGEITRATLERLAAESSEHSNDAIQTLIGEYERTLSVVNTRLADRVMNNYNLFVAGMGKIHELGLDLQQSAVICKNGRRVVQKVNNFYVLQKKNQYISIFVF